VERCWPAARPYGGEFGDDPTPHLTVAQADEPRLDQVQAQVTARLPLTVVVAQLQLLEFDGRHRRRWRQFSLGEDAQ
jgi:hypothetical protein